MLGVHEDRTQPPRLARGAIVIVRRAYAQRSVFEVLLPHADKLEVPILRWADYLPRRCEVERWYSPGGTERSRRFSSSSRAVPAATALAIARNVALDSSMASPA